jgi:hypothetical protein
MRWKEACCVCRAGDVMDGSCAVARGKDIDSVRALLYRMVRGLADSKCYTYNTGYRFINNPITIAA